MQQQHKMQRVGVFVDVQNMYYSAKNLYKAKVNFKEILKEAVKGRSLIRAIAYVIRADIPDEKNFYTALENIGYEVKAKDLQIFVGGAKKGDWDVGIAMDMIELGNKLDTVILVSGDGDYVPLLQHMSRAMGCRTEVVAFGKTSSGKLKIATDMFVDMDQNSRRYLIRSGPSEQSKNVPAKPTSAKIVPIKQTSASSQHAAKPAKTNK
jgi:uncharacterized LabA/DUF88 family protein